MDDEETVTPTQVDELFERARPIECAVNVLAQFAFRWSAKPPWPSAAVRQADEIAAVSD